MANEITTTDNSLQTMLQDAIPVMKQIAPKYVNVERLIALAIEVRKNPTLAKCSPMSVVDFCKKCAEWGTDRIGAGGVWAVPFWSNKLHGFEMVAIPDWRMMVEKVKKAGAIKHAMAEAVYSNDVFDYGRGMNPYLDHKPAKGDRGKISAVYCVYTLPDNTKDFVVMDWDTEILAIRDRTNAWKAWISKKISNPWVTDEVEQGKKTVIKRTLKLFEGASIELNHLLAADNVINGFTDITETTDEREPFQMPKIVSEQEPEQTPGDINEATGTLSDVQFAGDDDGKRYGINVGGRWFRTYSKTLGEKAESLKGKEVVIGYIKDGDYLVVDTIAQVVDQGEGSGALVAEIDALLKSLPEKNMLSVLKEAGVDPEEGEAWDQEGIKKLEEILSLAKAAQ